MNKWTRRFDDSRGSARPAGRRSARPLEHFYFAFLSYSHGDSEQADLLHQELERFRVPSALVGKLTANGVVPRRLTPIFRDQHELAAGHDLTDEIHAALAASRALIVLCSPAAAKSKWTNAEIQAFKRIHPDGCIIAAVIGGEPLASEMPGHEEEECFPPALLAKYDRHGKPTGKKTEPLAADLREGKGGHRVGFLKIVAGMLGVGLDELVQRETVRRQRRLAYVAAASLAGMAVTSGLAITAIQARDAAREQRRQAENLIGFMLGDLKDRLEPIGKLDALDGVGSRVLDYYKNQDTSQLSDQGLAQRSSALTLMGRIAQARGNLDTADKFIRAALAGTAESLRRSPNDPQRIFNHAQNVFWLGELARYRGQRSEADSAYREYKQLADRMVAIDPNNIKWQTEELYGEENIGIVELNHRQFDQAARDFEDALRLMQALASIGPSSVDHQKELATALAWSADAERARGRLDVAISYRERQVSTLNQLMQTAPGSDVREPLISAHQGLGVLLAEKGMTDRSITELKAAADEADALVPLEPRNAVWKSLAGGARLELARTLLAAGRRDDAAQQATTGCSLANSLPASDASSSKRKLAMQCAAMQARLALAAGAIEQAKPLAEKALSLARTQHSEDAVADLYGAAAMYLLIGNVRQRAGDSEGAAAAWNAGLAQLPAKVTERPWEMNLHAELLKRAGRTQDAAPLAARLSAIGYRSTI